MSSDRYYLRYSYLPFGEDRTHEFKGHRDLACEEVPKRQLHSRRSVSRNINGFLNTGEGGRIYLGILDNGMVAGLHLSEEQKDHICIALKDLMGRYTPPVPSSRYQIAFVPVLDGVRKGGRKWTEDSGLGSSGREVAVFCCEERERVRAHLLRTARHCWCDKHTKQLIMKGVSIPRYVVEISILPFVRDPTLPSMVLQLYPIYQNEQGRCYFRGSTSLQEYSYQQVAELTINEVETHFRTIKEQLKEEVKEYMKRVVSALADLANETD